MAEKRKSVGSSDLLESVYAYLLKEGHQKTAKLLLKEAKIDETKFDPKNTSDLADLHSFLSQK